MNFDEWVCYGIPEHISHDATMWLAKLDGDSLSVDEKIDFYTWLADDPQHQWAFEELSELWAKTALLDNLQNEYKPLQLVNAIAPELISTLEEFAPPPYQSYLPFLSLCLVTIGLLARYL
jgi:hypothetical protein